MQLTGSLFAAERECSKTFQYQQGLCLKYMVSHLLHGVWCLHVYEGTPQNDIYCIMRECVTVFHAELRVVPLNPFHTDLQQNFECLILGFLGDNTSISLRSR